MLAQTQAEADSYCRAGQMQLFQIDSATTQTAIFQVMYDLLTSGGYNYAFRVDGMRDTTDLKWYYYSYGKAAAFAGLKWYTTSDTIATHDSLVITNMAYPSTKVIQSEAVDGVPLGDKIFVLCEWPL